MYKIVHLNDQNFWNCDGKKSARDKYLLKFYILLEGTVDHGLLYLLDMKEKIKVYIMGSMYESLYPYKI